MNSTINNFNLINQNIKDEKFEVAYNLLKEISDKCGEWYYLNSISSINLGYYNEAFLNIKEAINIDPKNLEYKKVLDSYSFFRDDYERQTRRYRKRHSSCGCCCCCDDLCCCDNLCCCVGDDCCENITKLWVLDSICECFGGDFIDCF
ncbi:MAG: hypothetical protein R3Y64_05180 [Peptostreptococcaceae bacterium]